jgi:hypothetical protein
MKLRGARTTCRPYTLRKKRSLSFKKNLGVVERAHICNPWEFFRGFSELQEPSKVFKA